MEAVDISRQTAELSFGQKLRERRQAAGLSRRELADMAGVGAHSIYCYESDLRFPALRYRLALSVALESVQHKDVARAAVRVQWARGWSVRECSRRSGVPKTTWLHAVSYRHRDRMNPAVRVKLLAFIEKYGAADGSTGD